MDDKTKSGPIPWESVADAEVRELEAAMKADPKAFYVTDRANGFDRVLFLTPKLEEMARRVRGLVRVV